FRAPTRVRTPWGGGEDRGAPGVIGESPGRVSILPPPVITTGARGSKKNWPRPPPQTTLPEMVIGSVTGEDGASNLKMSPPAPPSTMPDTVVPPACGTNSNVSCSWLPSTSGRFDP